MLIDITRPLSSASLVYPGDPPLVQTKLKDIERGDAYNLSQLNLGLHTGTHLDAPRHFVADGATVDELPLNSLICLAQVVDVGDATAITPEHLAAAPLLRGQAVLFKSGNSALSQACWARRWTYLSPEAALRCVQIGVSLVGCDYLDLENPAGASGFPVHLTLLSAGIPLLENLDLSQVAAGGYELICLPLKLAGAEASPCRAVLRTLDEVRPATGAAPGR